MKDNLTTAQITQFIIDGFVRIDNAFSSTVARSCRSILWKDLPCDPDDPTTWKQPVIRLGMYNDKPFERAANTQVLHSAFDQLIGTGRWIPRDTMGTFPVRFPSTVEPVDTGWHVDASFPGEDAENFLNWRINIYSKGRALLMLFLFSDVTELDAPTRIRVGSHKDVAKVLAPFGHQGLSFYELAERLASLPERIEINATGKAGTVYLCHPFLAHAAQKHRGSQPKFMAQPPLILKEELNLDQRQDYYTPLQESISIGGLGRS